MKNKNYIKFGALVIVIIGTLAWLAVGGVSDGGAYYKTVAELSTMGGDAANKRIRVGGDVEEGSISRNGQEVRFVLVQESRSCRSFTPASTLSPILSRPAPRRWQMAGWERMASFTPRRSRPSAPRSTRPNPRQ